MAPHVTAHTPSAPVYLTMLLISQQEDRTGAPATRTQGMEEDARHSLAAWQALMYNARGDDPTIVPAS